MAERIYRPLFPPSRNERCFCGSGQRFKRCCGRPTTPRPPPHGVMVERGLLDAEACRAWCERLRDRPTQAATVFSRREVLDPSDEGDEVDYRITDTVKAGPHRPELEALVRRAIEQVIAPATERPFAWFEKPQVLRYRPGGHYAAHADSDSYSPEERRWFKATDRDISLLIYLNDDFTGGTLSFPDFNYVYEPQVGDLVFFPSDIRYRHQADPVESGERWVIVSWAAFEDEPKVRDAPPSNSVTLLGQEA